MSGIIQYYHKITINHKVKLMSRLFIYLFITTQQKDLRPLTLFEHTDRIEIV